MPNFKLSSVIGAPFRTFVTKQLTTRLIKGSIQDRNRSQEEVLFLGNQVAWTKLASSVKVTSDYIKKLRSSFQSEQGSFPDGWDTQDGLGLAKNWILQSGTSKLKLNQAATAAQGFEVYDTNLRYGVGTESSPYDGAYGLGGIKAQGYRPMPGITSVNVQTAGKLGSLRYATVNFKVWNMNQLDIIDALYFRLGYTMLLEWGNVQYFESANSETLQRNTSGVSNFFNDPITKEDIQAAINAKVVESQGNYDGMLGIVCNFDYSFNQDGGWDCSVKLIGLGSIMETQKVNITYVMPPNIKAVWDTIAKETERIRRKEAEAEAAKLNRIIDANNNTELNRVNTAYETQAAFKIKSQKDLATYITQVVYGQQNITDDAQQAPFLMNKQVFTAKYNSEYMGAVAYETIYNPVAYVIQDIDNTKRLYSEDGYYVPNATLPLSTTTIYQPPGSYYYPLIPGGKATLNLQTITSFIYNDVVKSIPNLSQNGVTLPRDFFYNVTREIRNRGNNELATFMAALVYNMARRHVQVGPYTPRQINDPTNGNYIGFIEGIGPDYTNNDTGFTGRGVTEWVGADTKIGNTDRRLENLAQGSETVTIIYPEELTTTIVLAGITGTETAASAGLTSFSFKELFTKIYEQLNNGYIQVKLLEGNDGISEEDGKKASVWNTSVNAYVAGTAKVPKVGADIQLTIPDFHFYNTEGAAKLTNTPVDEDAYNPKIFGFIPIGSQTSPNQPLFGTYTIGVTIRITTNLAHAFRDAYPPEGFIVPKDQANLQERAKPDYANTTVDQNNMATGLQSSLEALLTIVKYETLLKAKNNKHSVLGITADFLTSGVGSLPPLGQLFTKANAEWDIIDKQTLIDLVAGKPPAANYSRLLQDPVALGYKGYNAMLMQDYNQFLPGVDALTRWNLTPTVDFSKLFTTVTLPKNIYNSAQETTTFHKLDRPTYVSFGYLIFALNSLSMLFDTTKGTKITTGQAATSRPIFYIDYNPETNLCLTIESQLTVDPEVCIIEGSRNDDAYKDLFLSADLLPTDMFVPSKQDELSALLHDTYKTAYRYQGRTMNIMLNINYLLSIMRETTDKDAHNNVYLQPFLERIVSDVNKSIGDINALRVGYIDASNTVQITDDQMVPPKAEEQSESTLHNTPDGTFIMPVYGRQSLAKSFDFKTEISTKMSSMIAIGAQAQNNGATQNTDASSFSWLNRGVSDRIIVVRDNATQIVPIGPPPPPAKGKSTTKPKEDPNKVIATKFNTHIKNIHIFTNDDKHRGIYKEMTDASRNFYIQGSTKVKANESGSSGAMPLPLNTSFTIPGISGIIMGNGFILPEQVLPITLRGETVDTKYKYGFMVMGLDHAIESNQWTTSIKGQIIKIDKDKASLAMRKTSPVSAAIVGAMAAASAVVSAASSVDVSDYEMFFYLSWQQGPDGAAQHYSIWQNNGVIPRYKRNVPAVNIMENWPTGYRSAKGIGAGDIRRLYANDQQALAEAFIDVQKQAFAKKKQIALSRVTGTSSNRTNVRYADMYKVFQKYERSDINLTADLLATIACIENDMQTDTPSTAKYRTMYQISIEYPDFKTHIDSLPQSAGHAAGFTEYGNLDEQVSWFANQLTTNFNMFKQASGFVG